MGDHRPTLLVVDDEPGILKIVERFAEQQDFRVVIHSSGRDALACVLDVKPDVALVDLEMPGMGGLDVLREIRAVDPHCHVVLITAHPTVDTAVEAVRLGALDYLTKPFDFVRMGELLTTVRKGIERRAHLMRADADIAKQFEFHGMVGRSPAMQELFDSIRRFAPHARTILLTGETGTGKELVARALHALGPRRDRPLRTVNCSAVAETLFESELFGHQRGAFTGATETKVGLFEAANGGTLFLDEIGELGLSLQAKLLRAVEYGEVQRLGSVELRKADVQVIAATNRDLRTEAEAGRFRSDFYYRLSILELDLVPLRERREDIPYLTAAFLQEVSARLKKQIVGISPAAERLLLQAAWPGNIRELRNVIERSCLLSDSRILTEREVSAAMSSGRPRDPAQVPGWPEAVTPAERGQLRIAERDQIERTLQQVGGNKAEAARLLGVSRRSLYRWLDRLEMRG